MSWGEILRPPGGGVSQTMVFCYTKNWGVNCVRNIVEMVLFHSKEYLDWNITVFPMFHTQYIPDFCVAEHYGLRNTTSWGSKDLASESICRAGDE
jgi:hypothetical protein